MACGRGFGKSGPPNHRFHPTRLRLRLGVPSPLRGSARVKRAVGRCSKYDESVIPYYQIVNQKLNGDNSGGVSCEAEWAGASPAVPLSAGIR